MLNGADAEKKSMSQLFVCHQLNCTLCFSEEFLLEAPSQYSYLSNGNLQVQGVSDSGEYSDTMVSCDWFGSMVVMSHFIGSNVHYGNE